ARNATGSAARAFSFSCKAAGGCANNEVETNNPARISKPRIIMPLLEEVTLCRPAHRQSIDTQGRLADADRHALAILAAGADTGVELEVVADHRDAGHRVGAVADQRRALDRAGHLAVLDEVGLAHRKDELAAGDIDLAATEIGGIDPFLDRGDDFLRVVL